VAAQVVAGLAVLATAAAGPHPRRMRRTRRLIAVTLGVAGVVIVLSARRTLGEAFSIFPRPTGDGALHTAGPYRVVRHPMYTGVIAHALAASMAGSPWALIPAGALAVILDRKAGIEETALAERYPGYDAYRRRTRWRVVPGIR
jgi:protein-S-isoprenylcysteine O-methyltransferase Ste14